MNIPYDLSALYSDIGFKKLIYIKARYRMSPISIIEEMTPKSGRIYDIGCGAGLLSNLLSLRSSARDVVGIDISGEKISIARTTIRKRTNIRFEAGDAVSFSMDRPDVVVAVDVLHHIPASMHKDFIKHIYDSLARGGAFILQDIDKKPFLKYWFSFIVDKITNPASQVNYRTRNEVVKLLEETGFNVEARNVDKGYPIAAVTYKCVKMS